MYYLTHRLTSYTHNKCPALQGPRSLEVFPECYGSKPITRGLKHKKRFHIHRMFICSSPPNIWDVYLKTTHHIWDLSCPKKSHI